METSNKKIETLEELVAKGTGKYYFQSNHQEVMIDKDFAQEFCRRHRLRRNGDFLIYNDYEGQHFAILYNEWKCECQYESWHDEGFQVIKV